MLSDVSGCVTGMYLVVTLRHTQRTDYGRQDKREDIYNNDSDIR